MSSLRWGNRIGSGGMADVYEGIQQEIGRPVAIKIIKEHLADNPNFVNRFEREARISSKMQHPSLVQVYDMGRYENRPYLVMELLHGQTLEQRLQRVDGRPPQVLGEAEATGIVLCVLDGLIYAHERMGVVHRDIKPSNIFLASDNTIKLMDFGIASAFAEVRLTLVGDQMGTPQYMAPEQIEGTTVLDFRTDLYALGIVLYEMLTGDTPYSADTPVGMLHKKLHLPPPVLPAGFSPRVQQIVARCLQTRPDDRFASAREMKDAFLAPASPFPASAFSGAPSAVPASGFNAPAAPPPFATPPIQTAGYNPVGGGGNMASDQKRKKTLVGLGAFIAASVVVLGVLASRPQQPEPVKQGGTVPAASPSPEAVGAVPGPNTSPTNTPSKSDSDDNASTRKTDSQIKRPTRITPKQPDRSAEIADSVGVQERRKLKPVVKQITPRRRPTPDDDSRINRSKLVDKRTKPATRPDDGGISPDF